MVQTWLEQNRPGKYCSGFMASSCAAITSKLLKSLGFLVGHVIPLNWLSTGLIAAFSQKSLIVWCYCNAELMQSCRWEWSTQSMCDAVMFIIALIYNICVYIQIYHIYIYTYSLRLAYTRKWGNVQQLKIPQTKELRCKVLQRWEVTRHGPRRQARGEWKSEWSETQGLIKTSSCWTAFGQNPTFAGVLCCCHGG